MLAMYLPSGDHETLLFMFIELAIFLGVVLVSDKSKIAIEPSVIEVATKFPSGDHAAPYPQDISLRSKAIELVDVSQTCSIVSPSNANLSPNGAHTILLILPCLPFRTCRNVIPGTGEPPISVKVVADDSSCPAGAGGGKDLRFGTRFGCLRFRLLIDAALRRMQA